MTEKDCFCLHTHRSGQKYDSWLIAIRGIAPNCNDPKSNILVRRAPSAGQIWASKIPQKKFQIFVEKLSLLKLNKCKTVEIRRSR